MAPSTPNATPFKGNPRTAFALSLALGLGLGFTLAQCQQPGKQDSSPEVAGTGRGGTGPKEAGAAAEATGEAWDEARRPRRGAPRRRLSLAPTTPAIPESTRVRDRGPGADRESARSESRDDIATYGVVKSLSKASGAQKEAHANG